MSDHQNQIQSITDNEECEISMEFYIEKDDRRRFHRFCVPPEFYILDTEKSRVLDAADLSSGGICLLHKGWRFVSGDLITFDLIYRDHFILKNANAVVVRVDSKCIGCRFINITPAVGEKLTRYVVKQIYPDKD